MKQSYISNLLSLLIILVIAISCKNSTEPENNKCDLEVTVHNYSSYSTNVNPAPFAKVYIKGYSTTITTDGYGKYLFTDLDEGIYEVYAYVEKSGSGKETVQLQKGILNKVNIALINGVNNEPTITVNSPINNYYYPIKTIVGDTIYFRYSIKDNITSSNQIAVTLSGDKTGVLKEGFPKADGTFEYKTNSLSKGRHIIRVVAKDGDSNVCRDSIIVDNIRPQRAIVSAKVESGKYVTMNWTVSNDVSFQKYVVLRSSSRNKVV